MRVNFVFERTIVEKLFSKYILLYPTFMEFSIKTVLFNGKIKKIDNYVY